MADKLIKFTVPLTLRCAAVNEVGVKALWEDLRKELGYGLFSSDYRMEVNGDGVLWKDFKAAFLKAKEDQRGAS